MKTKTKTVLAVIALLPAVAFAQKPADPPQPPNPPAAPNYDSGPPKDRSDRRLPKVPVTFLGVETSPVPQVVSEQLGLAKGFGLVVDYVVPDGPAAAAGVQQNDILKMLNDQILLEPGQLAKLIRSYSEGTTITLTILRKGKEEKVTVKLIKKDVPQHPEFSPRHEMGFPFGDRDFGDVRDQLNDMKEQFGDTNHGMIHDAVMTAQAEAQRVRDAAQRRRDQAQRIRDRAQRIRDQAQRVSEQVREEARRAAGQINITRTDGGGGLRTTKIDIGKAQIVFSDDKGELRLESVDGKKILTAKDPQSRLVYSGPVDTQEEIDKIPAEVRQRFESFKERDLHAVISANDENNGDDESADEDNDNDDERNDEGQAPPVEQI